MGNTRNLYSFCYKKTSIFEFKIYHHPFVDNTELSIVLIAEYQQDASIVR